MDRKHWRNILSWLKEVTNKDEAYWMSRIQSLISQHTVAKEDGHGETDSDWIKRLADEVVDNLPQSGHPYDGNMRMAAILSSILGLWYSQVHQAKTFDAHRPTFERQQAYFARQTWALDFLKNLLDMSNGPIYFPGQPWQFCFDPEAKGGDFL